MVLFVASDEGDVRAHALFHDLPARLTSFAKFSVHFSRACTFSIFSRFQLLENAVFKLDFAVVIIISRVASGNLCGVFSRSWGRFDFYTSNAQKVHIACLAV